MVSLRPPTPTVGHLMTNGPTLTAPPLPIVNHPFSNKIRPLRPGGLVQLPTGNTSCYSSVSSKIVILLQFLERYLRGNGETRISNRRKGWVGGWVATNRRLGGWEKAKIKAGRMGGGWAGTTTDFFPTFFPPKILLVHTLNIHP